MLRVTALVALALMLIPLDPETGVLGARVIPEMDQDVALHRAKSALANPRNFARPNFTVYHSRTALLDEVKAIVLRHPNRLALDVQRLELNGYSAELHSVTVAWGSAQQSPNGTDLRIRALMDFGQHGREHITSEVALRLLQLLAGERLPHSSLNQKLRLLLPHIVLKIVPMENINGREKVDAGDLCERKNGRGVDTNRNWSVDWGKKEKDYDPREEYPGTGPFSEPEAELLRQLAVDFQPHLWVNVHSGMEALFMPYDHRKGTPQDGSAAATLALLQGVNTRHLDNKCVVGSGGSSVGYLAHGTATDWMYDELRVPLAFTFEIYGDSAAHDNDCFRMFNPTSSEGFEHVISTWATAFLALLLSLPTTLDQIPSRLLPHHAWSTTDDLLLSEGSSLVEPTHSRAGLINRPSDTVNGHLRRRAALKAAPSGRVRMLRLSQTWVAVLGLLCVAVYLSRCMKGQWQWWRWRWQLALARKKETPV